MLDAGFWHPTLLAREVRLVDQLTGRRLELGLRTGHVRTEFEAAGLPWESPGRRVDRLAAMVHTPLASCTVIARLPGVSTGR